MSESEAEYLRTNFDNPERIEMILFMTGDGYDPPTILGLYEGTYETAVQLRDIMNMGRNTDKVSIETVPRLTFN